MLFRQDYKDFLFFVLCGVVGGAIVLNGDKILALRPVRGHQAPRKHPRNRKLNASHPTRREPLYKR